MSTGGVGGRSDTWRGGGGGRAGGAMPGHLRRQLLTKTTKESVALARRRRSTHTTATGRLRPRRLCAMYSDAEKRLLRSNAYYTHLVARRSGTAGWSHPAGGESELSAALRQVDGDRAWRDALCRLVDTVRREQCEAKRKRRQHNAAGPAALAALNVRTAAQRHGHRAAAATSSAAGPSAHGGTGTSTALQCDEHGGAGGGGEHSAGGNAHVQHGASATASADGAASPQREHGTGESPSQSQHSAASGDSAQADERNDTLYSTVMRCLDEDERCAHSDHDSDYD